MNYEKTNKIPQHVIDYIARMLLPEIQKSYNSGEGKEIYEKYSAELEKKANKGSLD